MTPFFTISGDIQEPIMDGQHGEAQIVEPMAETAAARTRACLERRDFEAQPQRIADEDRRDELPLIDRDHRHGAFVKDADLVKHPGCHGDAERAVHDALAVASRAREFDVGVNRIPAARMHRKERQVGFGYCAAAALERLAHFEILEIKRMCHRVHPRLKP